jgi:hypothetical protein
VGSAEEGKGRVCIRASEDGHVFSDTWLGLYSCTKQEI